MESIIIYYNLIGYNIQMYDFVFRFEEQRTELVVVIYFFGMIRVN